jgi:hypothetical protein
MKIKPKDLRRYKNWKVISFMYQDKPNDGEDCEVTNLDGGQILIVYNQPWGGTLFWVLHPTKGIRNSETNQIITMDKMWRQLAKQSNV